MASPILFGRREVGAMKGRVVRRSNCLCNGAHFDTNRIGILQKVLLLLLRLLSHSRFIAFILLIESDSSPSPG